MSILIRDMTMPTSCDDCCMNNGIMCYAVPEYTEDGVVGRTEDRPDWCPLVPVPPHCRLIDADALYDVVKKRTRNWNDGWSDIECVLTGNDIKNAPTVIEAEEGNQ